VAGLRSCGPNGGAAVGDGYLGTDWDDDHASAHLVSAHDDTAAIQDATVQVKITV
jgi:hypothetical protein